jgi:hypothetical protein
MKVEKPAAKEGRIEVGLAPSPSEEREPWGWTRRQRVGLGILLGLLLVCLVVQYVRRPFWREDRIVVLDGERIALPMRIDPNEATVEELGRIPHVGEATAKKIIAWRDSRKPTAADGTVFRRIEDLDAVPGIGKRLLDEMRPFLRFPGDEAE